MEQQLWRLALILPLYLLPWLVALLPWSWRGSNASPWRRQRRRETRGSHAGLTAGHHAGRQPGIQ
jgi:hypothetical protein